ncbi:MAG: hypothetical protein IPM59_11875 [Chloracidobacterium sp.]|nr:hypothetical protein [Chloracidobacterium sp.]
MRYAITIQVYDGCEKLAEHTQIMIPRMGKLVRVDSQQLNSFFMLSELGFEHEDPFLPNGDFLLALDLGNLYLQAGSGLNARFVPVVNVWGTHHTGRTLTEIKIELPTEIASREHLLALLTFFLLHQLGQDFEPNFHTELIQEGKTLTHLLPRQFRAGMKG